jgi:hypothetical protein
MPADLEGRAPSRPCLVTIRHSDDTAVVPPNPTQPDLDLPPSPLATRAPAELAFAQPLIGGGTPKLRKLPENLPNQGKSGVNWLVRPISGTVFGTNLVKFATNLIKFTSNSIKFATDLIKFSSELIKFAGNLTKFPTDLLKFAGNLMKFVTDLIKFAINLINFATDLIKFPTELIKPGTNLIKSLRNLITFAV